MKRVLMGLAILLLLFVLLIGVFTVVFILQSDSEIAEAEQLTPEDMQVIFQQRDSLLVQVDSLTVLLAELALVRDSLAQQLTTSAADITDLNNRLQLQEAENVALRKVEVGARDMARTFATMSVEELTPIMSRLSDDVITSIYEQTTTKRRKFLLNAMGMERAAALANQLVKEEQEGS